MGNFCSTSTPAQILQPKKELTSVKSVKIAPGNFVKENLGNFFEVYTLDQPPLGSGAWGEVRKCIHNSTGETRVVKIIKKSDLPVEYVHNRTAFNEAMILKKLDHPNLPRIFEFFEDEASYFIVMEYIKGGDLFDKILELKTFSDEQASKIMHQLLLATNYLHGKGIVHRDIKPENVMMVSREGLDIKLADFDTATVYSGSNFKQMLGTPLYMAPEIIKGKYNEKCDVWSCGIILYILLRGCPPYNGEDDEIMKILKNVNIKFDDPYWQTVHPDALDLLKKMLNPKKDERISAAEACAHEWFTSTSDLPVTDIDFEKVIDNIKDFKSECKIREAVHTFIISKILDPSVYKKELAVFYMFDKDKDGKISKDEMENILRNRGMTEEEAKSHSETIFTNTDIDKSGFIDFTEFLRASISKKDYLTRENIVKAFELFDQDQSGAIEIEEIKHWLDDDRTAAQDLIRELLEPLDNSKTGRVELDEFETYMIEGVRRRTTYFKEKNPLPKYNKK